MKPLLPLLLLLAGFSAYSQDYKWAVGLRLGGNPGFTMKKSLESNRYFEGILSPDEHGFLAVTLLEQHKALLAEPGLSWYYGAGGHAGFWNNTKNNNYFKYGDNRYAIGLDGILGIEYSFLNLPFDIGLDWKPAFNLIENTGFYIGNGALSIRFKLM
ncbi:hypothetical protein GC194_09060 [bacterium]|nr:hypothetical protein [bacterium]